MTLSVNDMLVISGCIVIGAGCSLTISGPYRRVMIFVTALILGAIWAAVMNGNAGVP